MTPQRQTAGTPLPLTKRKAWKKLQTHFKKVRETHLRTLFAEDVQRAQAMTAEGA
jgi:hypothetical protein